MPTIIINYCLHFMWVNNSTLHIIVQRCAKNSYFLSILQTVQFCEWYKSVQHLVVTINQLWSSLQLSLGH